MFVVNGQKANQFDNTFRISTTVRQSLTTGENVTVGEIATIGELDREAQDQYMVSLSDHRDRLMKSQLKMKKHITVLIFLFDFYNFSFKGFQRFCCSCVVQQHY